MPSENTYILKVWYQQLSCNIKSLKQCVIVTACSCTKRLTVIGTGRACGASVNSNLFNLSLVWSNIHWTFYENKLEMVIRETRYRAWTEDIVWSFSCWCQFISPSTGFLWDVPWNNWVCVGLSPEFFHQLFLIKVLDCGVQGGSGGGQRYRQKWKFEWFQVEISDRKIPLSSRVQLFLISLTSWFF